MFLSGPSALSALNIVSLLSGIGVTFAASYSTLFLLATLGTDGMVFGIDSRVAASAAQLSTEHHLSSHVPSTDIVLTLPGSMVLNMFNCPMFVKINASPES